MVVWGLSVDGSLGDTRGANLNGAVAQLGEHLLCKQGVSGSIPLSSTMVFGVDALRDLSLSLKKNRFAPDICLAPVVDTL